MVYCSKCGTLNPDIALNCSNCGAPLFAPENRPFSRYERRRYYRANYGYSQGGGGGIGLLLIGLFIILVGLAAFGGFTAFWNYFWPILLVMVGVWILALALRRNRRYNQTPPA